LHADDFCDPLRANTCMGAKCVCGTTGSLCPPGTRCANVGMGFACVCDKYSDCEGCCAPNGLCMPPETSLCGAAGIACQKCLGASGTSPKCEGPAWGVGACSNFVGCLACTGKNECCSGNTCSAFGGFPTCRSRPAGVPSVCESCDVLRTNNCHWQTGQCACGDAGPCSQGHTCEEGKCKSIF
jgi:hypothetical protein